MTCTSSFSRVAKLLVGISFILLLTSATFAQKKGSRDSNDSINVANVVSVLVENSKLPVEIVKGAEENKYWFTAKSYTAPKGGCWITFLSPGGSFKIVDATGREQFAIENTTMMWGQLLYILEGWSIMSTCKWFFSGYNKL